MISTLLGQKTEMTQMFVDGARVPVTNVILGPCVVTQIKTKQKDGYDAIQIGYGWKKIKNITKPMQGHLKEAIKDKKAPLFLSEVQTTGENELKVNDIVNLTDIFHEGDTVTVVGTTKGKGFAGVVKRWGFSGAPASHGHGGILRAPGSVGQGTTPGRVYKGKKMPGRTGATRKTVSGMKIVAIDAERNIISISGSIPGARNSYVTVTQTKAAKVKNKEMKKQEKDEN